MSQATTETDVAEDGVIARVSGPVVTATGLTARMNDVVYVGNEGLMGEVIEIEGDLTTVQVYEETSGVGPGEPVENTGEPLTVDLGPGLLDSIYDGVQRPLDVLQAKMGTPFLDRGVDAPGIDLEETWTFEPTVAEGDTVGPGDIVGTVPETESIEHKVLVPPDAEGGTVTAANAGEFAVTEAVVELDSGESVTMHQEWPVREARPSVEKHSPRIPLISGQRILDGLFPIAKGGTAAIPGPFGSGKCVLPSTPVLLSSGETIPIEELFERVADGMEVPDGEVLLEADEELLTFDPAAGSIRPAPISHVYRGSTDRIVRIETASGRELELTPAHKLFTVGEGLRIQETPAGTLEAGDSVVMPRRLNIDGSRERIDAYELIPDARIVDRQLREVVATAIRESDLTYAEVGDIVGVSKGVVANFSRQQTRPTLGFVEGLFTHLGRDLPSIERAKAGSNGKPVRVPSHVCPELAEFLGLLLSDGMITAKTVRFHNNDDALRERFVDLAEDLFGVACSETVHNTVQTALAHSRVLTTWLRGLGVPAEQKSVTACIPDVIKAGDGEVVAAFLRGYYLGDGSISGGTVEIATSSDAMASDLTYALARLGVFYRRRTRANGATRITISSADELRRFVTAISDGSDHPKIAKIDAYVSGTTSNTNVDTVPVDETTMRAIADLARYSEFKEAGVEITNFTGLKQRPAMSSIASVLPDGGADVIDRVSSVVSMMDDVFFDPIVAVEVRETHQTVYDVTVPETHNFLGGELPSVLHNTVTQHSLAKWADADIVIYVGCGERGNEMTEVIEDFPELEDPVTGKPLMSRTCLIANTSNMPVAARESCVYTGITIAEYYRDMGYDVALMADSTSRWAEAMREISSRLEEMPGEEGYPAYLAARLAEFYERSGRFTLLNDLEGSISVIGAVSPPGGDFSEPVTQNTLRIVKAFWALDSDLKERRHFPSINWNDSYSLYRNQLDPWFEEEVAADWAEVRQWAIDTLDEENELQEIVQLVGKDALPDDQQLTLEVARYLREGFLQQNAFHEVDQYCDPKKTYRIWQAIQTFDEEAFAALDAGVPVTEIQDVDAAPRLNRIGPQEDYEAYLEELETELTEQLRELY